VFTSKPLHLHCLAGSILVHIHPNPSHHQTAVLSSHNKSATNSQPAVLFSQNKSASAIRHRLDEQVDCLSPLGTAKANKKKSTAVPPSLQLRRVCDSDREMAACGISS
jgi:hypothetical protein